MDTFSAAGSDDKAMQIIINYSHLGKFSKLMALSEHSSTFGLTFLALRGREEKKVSEGILFAGSIICCSLAQIDMCRMLSRHEQLAFRLLPPPDVSLFGSAKENSGRQQDLWRLEEEEPFVRRGLRLLHLGIPSVSKQNAFVNNRLDTMKNVHRYVIGRSGFQDWIIQFATTIVKNFVPISELLNKRMSSHHAVIIQLFRSLCD